VKKFENLLIFGEDTYENLWLTFWPTRYMPKMNFVAE